MKRLISALLSPLLVGCSVVGIHSDIEQLPYEVVASLSDNIEIRQYAERIAIEATVKAHDPGDAQKGAFRLLFDYISGANQAKKEIAMTAPVESQFGEKGATTMRFFLPRRFTLESAPDPVDDRVRLVVLPEQRLAVMNFSGSRSQQVLSARLEQIHEAFDGLDLNLKRTSERAFFYDPPWTLPWFRRNEVAIEVINNS